MGSHRAGRGGLGQLDTQQKRSFQLTLSRSMIGLQRVEAKEGQP